MQSDFSHLAAVDLGSNSFRLSIAKVIQHGDQPQIYASDKIKKTVRLAAGLDEQNHMDQETIDRALQVLRMFGERLSGFKPEQVRVVATNTFRITRNIDDLMAPAEEALGFPIEIIPGQEEARLIYLGVVHELPPSDEHRLVVDIGGGSTEFIIGKKTTPKLLKSLPMGCVFYTKRFFSGGKAIEKAFEKAELAAREQVEVISETYQHLGWQEAFGSSGTAKALVAVLESNGLSQKGITLEGMEALKKIIIKNGSADASQIKNLKKDRVEVLPAGLAIMMAIFRELNIKQMYQGDGALRMGVLYDLLGRSTAGDKRVESVKLFMDRYHIDAKQADRLRQLALKMFDDCLPDAKESAIRRLLGWSCDLHEAGLSISQSSYHKHTAYILANADMPGFSSHEQKVLSILTQGHVGKLSKIDLDTMTTEQRIALLCIRLAALFMRKRMDQDIPELNLASKGKQIVLHVDKDWLTEQPLTEYGLEQEAESWQKEGYKFSIK